MADVSLKVSIDLIRAILVDDLGGKAQDILQAIYVLNPTVFTGVLPITEIVFQASITSYNTKRSAYKLGGLSQKIPYDNAHDALTENLILLAPYVDGIANGDEVILKLSMMPYDTGVNDTAALIADGALPTGLNYKPGVTGAAQVSCEAFGKGTKFICIAVQGGPLPAGVVVTMGGQISLPSGETLPPTIISLNGRRSKTLVNMVVKTDYYLYYLMSCGNVMSGLSLHKIIVCGN